jgi:hypothetical protein
MKVTLELELACQFCNAAVPLPLAVLPLALVDLILL